MMNVEELFLEADDFHATAGAPARVLGATARGFKGDMAVKFAQPTLPVWNLLKINDAIEAVIPLADGDRLLSVRLLTEHGDPPLELAVFNGEQSILVLNGGHLVAPKGIHFAADEDADVFLRIRHLGTSAHQTAVFGVVIVLARQSAAAAAAAHAELAAIQARAAAEAMAARHAHATAALDVAAATLAQKANAEAELFAAKKAQAQAEADAKAAELAAAQAAAQADEAKAAARADKAPAAS